MSNSPGRLKPPSSSEISVRIFLVLAYLLVAYLPLGDDAAHQSFARSKKSAKKSTRKSSTSKKKVSQWTPYNLEKSPQSGKAKTAAAKARAAQPGRAGCKTEAGEQLFKFE